MISNVLVYAPVYYMDTCWNTSILQIYVSLLYLCSVCWCIR